MKPVFAKENGRWSTVYNSEKYQDVYFVGFRVKFDGSEKLQTLTIKTDKNYSVALSYSIDGSSDVVCDEFSWTNALLQAANQDGYCAARPKEFELHTKESEYYYALTEASKSAIWKDHKEAMDLFRHSFTAGTAFALPNTKPGPKFQNNASELQSTSSISIDQELSPLSEEITKQVTFKEVSNNRTRKANAPHENSPQYSLIINPEVKPSQIKETHPSLMSNISMMVIGGFIAAAGITAIAIAFTVLNAATFGVAGLLVTGLGVAATLSGAGLFATGAYKHLHTIGEDSLGLSGNLVHQ
ncbi:hypothetical protein [Legionella pneumophila]